VSETITLELPEPLVYSARIVAERTSRRIEEVLMEWLDQAAAELPVEMLPDEQVLALRDLQMSDEQQNELSVLLADQREQRLDARQRARLNELLAIYRHGMARKAQALKTAVERGLQPSVT
jgi:dsDNA-binding SOS-regulon protein